MSKADLETVIGDLMFGQYSDPVRVVAFNTAEQWSADVSQEVAHEIRRRADLAGIKCFTIRSCCPTARS
jgi:hypothetical protein